MRKHFGAHGVSAQNFARICSRIGDISCAVPVFNTLSTALITASDSAFMPKEISNSKAAERIEAKGFATPLPVMSCAEPCIGSYTPVPSPTDAEASMPIEPAICDASSVRISPKD